MQNKSFRAVGPVSVIGISVLPNASGGIGIPPELNIYYYNVLQVGSLRWDPKNIFLKIKACRQESKRGYGEVLRYVHADILGP